MDKKKLGIVMDPISKINYKKDSTLAMLWEAQNRQWDIYYFEQQDMILRDGIPHAKARLLQVNRDADHWFDFKGEKESIALTSLNAILMRKDPPFNEQYIYTTYLLEQAERHGVLVVNKPQALRDANEKLFAAYFPQCSPPMVVSQTIEELHLFWREYEDIVCKPLDSMGGTSVFRLKKDDVNATVIFETLTKSQTTYIMAQQFIPDIINGDKRILLINGEPIPFALARVPQGNDWRGNLAAGAKGKVQPLTQRDEWICQQVGPELKKRGLYFVGIDVIGDYLTEINVTSPTGIRELEQGTGINIAGKLFDFIEGVAF